MPYAAKIVLDSISPSGCRLTTFEVTYPRMIHSELMTHRVFSRNAASSRAIPVSKMIERVEKDPAMPVWFGKTQAGMQANEEVEDKEGVLRLWLQARDNAVASVKSLLELKLHKQITNRLLEPFMFITVIVTATEWENFFKLRCHPDAQPEIREIANMMRDCYQNSTPQKLSFGQWHVPMLFDDERKDLDETVQLKISTARCARISYLTHDGRKDYHDDEKLHDRLAESGHWSPFEHSAQACEDSEYQLSNFRGWNQYRKKFSSENGCSQ